MARPTPKLKATKPKNFFTKPLKADLKDLFKALSKGIGHTVTGKWEELGTDTVEALSSVGLSTEPGELAFVLIRRSITKALFELLGESAGQLPAEANKDQDALLDRLDFTISLRGTDVDRKFLDRPSELPVIQAVESLLRQWLEIQKVAKPAAEAIAGRFPGYFVYALNQEWRRNAKSYATLLEALQTPFTKAGDREWAWAAYGALLQRRVEEGIFDEPFSLKQIFIPLNAYYLEEPTRKDSMADMVRGEGSNKRIVVGLDEELEDWLKQADAKDPIRVISGGPGSGKSSFLRIFAAKVAQTGRLRVLFVPLHLIDPAKDLADEVGRFTRDEGVLVQNPLDPESPEPNLLLILDGLDELASQGKAAAETARAFVREVERTVERRNLQSMKLRVLLSGREMVVQENQAEFRRKRQVLNVLPYVVPDKSEAGDYVDSKKLLEQDLRQDWWKNFGALTGKAYQGLPAELNRDDLTEITAQPLLNYLIALSFVREKVDFTKDINLNLIYGDLVGAVHERAYEKGRGYGPIRHMKLDDFSRILEEIGLAAWHGDGRTTTVREIEDHCRASGLGRLLDVFQDGAKAGVTRLLAAFFFRQYGQRASGDPTFVFTHKSFGEYLAARRVVRATAKVIRELDSRAKSPDEGWDEKDALKHWAQVCGKSAISRYLHVFFLNEIALHKVAELQQWQSCLTKLFSHMLQHGMPMELLPVQSFREAYFQSCNAEEALLVALNACARVTKTISTIRPFDSATFGAWFKRVQGQRTGGESALAGECLSFLDLSNTVIDIGDFYSADFRGAKLRGIRAHFATFANSNLSNADLQEAVLFGASLEEAHLQEADLQEADLRRAYLRRAHLQRAHLEEAHLQEADLQEADLRKAHLQGANLQEAHLRRANLREVHLEGADLEGANLQEAHLEGANLEGANLRKANLRKANFYKADTRNAILPKGVFRQIIAARTEFIAQSNDELESVEGKTETNQVSTQRGS